MSRGRIAAVLVGVGLVAACDRNRPVSDVTTTSANVRSEPQALPPPSHTVDSAGYVDNAGRTSDQRGRTEMSGMRGSEAGSQQVTGTPGSGIPLPIEPSSAKPPQESKPTVPKSSNATSAAAPADALVGRVAQALCDREGSCERIGKGKAHPTKATCLDTVRAPARTELSAAGCENGFDSTAIATCLGSIRNLACEAKSSGLASIRGCEATMMCFRP